MLNRRSILTASIAAALGRLAPSIPAAEPLNTVSIACDPTPMVNALKSLNYLIQSGVLSPDELQQIRDMENAGTLAAIESHVRQYKEIWVIVPSAALKTILESPDNSAPQSSADAYLALVAAMSR